MGAFYRFFGKSFGNFRSATATIYDFEKSLAKMMNALPAVQKIFAPKPEFTNRILCPRTIALAAIGSFNRITPSADGIVIDRPNVGAAIFNADCPVVGVFSLGAPRLALLHAGFRCLVRENEDEPGIIKVLFRNNAAYGFDPKAVEVFVGFGIGPCCFGADHLSEVQNLAPGLAVSRAIKGPRKGQHSVDLYKLIRAQLLAEGVPLTAIDFNLECSACAGGKYHSHVYDERNGKVAGRNAALAWFV